MERTKHDIKKVLKLDAIAAFLKLMSVAFIIVIFINIIVGISMWYITILIDLAFILAYKLRANFIKKQFNSYAVIYATLEKFNLMSPMQGTRSLTYFYEYEGQEYTTSAIIADFFRESHSIREKSAIKIIVNTSKPYKSKIINLHPYTEN